MLLEHRPQSKHIYVSDGCWWMSGLVPILFPQDLYERSSHDAISELCEGNNYRNIEFWFVKNAGVNFNCSFSTQNQTIECMQQLVWVSIPTLILLVDVPKFIPSVTLSTSLIISICSPTVEESMEDQHCDG